LVSFINGQSLLGIFTALSPCMKAQQTTAKTISKDQHTQMFIPLYPSHLKMQDSAGIRNAFRQGID